MANWNNWAWLENGTRFEDSNYDWLYNAGDELGIAAAISDVGNWINDNIITPVGDYISNNNVAETAIDVLTGGAITTNRTNREIAAENIAYQERENEIIRQREDTAVQRGAADMSAAGLSQTLAAGNPASTTSTTAPHNDYKMEKINLLSGILNLKKTMQDMKTSSALADKYSAEASGLNLSNGAFAEEFANEQAYKTALTEKAVSESKYHDALTDIKKIEGEKKGDYINAEIANMLSESQYHNMQSTVAAREVAHKIAQTNNLDKDTEYLVEQIAYERLKQEALQHDINIARSRGSRTSGDNGTWWERAIGRFNIANGNQFINLPDFSYEGLGY